MYRNFFFAHFKFCSHQVHETRAFGAKPGFFSLFQHATFDAGACLKGVNVKQTDEVLYAVQVREMQQ